MPNRALIFITKNGMVQSATGQAEELVAKYFGKPIRLRGRLPPALLHWVKSNATLNIESNIVPPIANPLSVRREGKRLVVWFLPTMYRDILLLGEVDRSIELETLKPPLPPELLGLTRREAEVLIWVAQGKTNAEIGTILDLSPRTVQKHLEHMYQKLSVTSRTAAMLRAIPFLPLPRPETRVGGA